MQTEIKSPSEMLDKYFPVPDDLIHGKLSGVFIKMMEEYKDQFTGSASSATAEILNWIEIRLSAESKLGASEDVIKALLSVKYKIESLVGNPTSPVTAGGAEPCPDCEGDGISRCNNPDHGFIEGVGGETGRLGCPVCGHDELYRVRHWNSKEGKYEWEKCDTCGGSGKSATTPSTASAGVWVKASDRLPEIGKDVCFKILQNNIYDTGHYTGYTIVLDHFGSKNKEVVEWLDEGAAAAPVSPKDECKHEWVESPAGFTQCWLCKKYMNHP